MKFIRLGIGLSCLGLMLVSGKRVGAVNSQISCQWCDRSCTQRLNTEVQCADNVAPLGKTCVLENGNCVVKSGGDEEVGGGNPSPTTSPATSGSCKTCPSGESKAKGDANCDGKIDREDFLVWKNEYKILRLGGVGRVAMNSDFDCDGKTTVLDFVRWKINWLKKPETTIQPTAPSSPTPGVTKEPLPAITGGISVNDCKNKGGQCVLAKQQCPSGYIENTTLLNSCNTTGSDGYKCCMVDKTDIIVPPSRE